MAQHALLTFFVCVVVGYLFYDALAGQEVGAPPRIGKSLVWYWGAAGGLGAGRHGFHCHHWFLHALLLIAVVGGLALTPCNCQTDRPHGPLQHLPWWTIAALGFLVGGMLQGWTYGDWRELFVERREQVAKVDPPRSRSTHPHPPRATA